MMEPSDAVSARPAPSSARRKALRRRLAPWAPLLVLAGLSLLVALANANFLDPRNLVRVANSAAIPLVLSVGATFVILLGSIDLSIEGVLEVASSVVSLLVRNDYNVNDFGLLGAAAAVAMGGLIGVANGALHVGLRIPSFMATLGTWFIGVGLATILLGGSSVRVLDPGIRSVALDRLLGFPIAVWIALAAFLVGLAVERRTRLGRYVYAIGGGEDLALLSGIPVRRVKIAVFALAGLFYGLGGLMAAAQLGQGNATIGDGRLFTTITAVVVGGTALSGGEGGMLNTLVGVLIVAVLSNGMILVGVSPYVQQAVQGLMIIVAVALSLDRARLRIVK